MGSFAFQILFIGFGLKIVIRQGRKRVTMAKKVKQLRRQFSSLANSSHNKEETETEPLSYNSSTWVPHPRTGIYFPQGHEWVMKDVPENAASFSPVFWFRDFDGVDDLNPDAHPSPGPRLAAVLGAGQD
ncbi:hypothetical protein SDJN02_16223, partial [Cucurbita argyrosperma subsp. argyrosperma]